MQPCKDMCKVIDFSLVPACFSPVRSWSWQDRPACRGFASTWAPTRQDRNPKCCFMAHLEQPTLVLSSPVQPLSTGWPWGTVGYFPLLCGFTQAKKEWKHLPHVGIMPCLEGLAKAVARGSANTQAPEAGALPGMLHCLPPKGLHTVLVGQESR